MVVHANEIFSFVSFEICALLLNQISCTMYASYVYIALYQFKPDIENMMNTEKTATVYSDTHNKSMSYVV